MTTQNNTKVNSPRCDLCNEIITKYKMDLGSSDSFSIRILNEGWKLICGDCARDIATKVIHQ